MLRFSVDLEMEQPSNEIIQIGVCKFNEQTGEIVGKFNRFIKLGRPLSEYIKKLTSIKDEDLDGGTTLKQAYLDLVEFTQDCNFQQAIVWGNGDMYTLKQQLNNEVEWVYGSRVMDVKSLHQFIGPLKGLNRSGGLAKVLTKYGLKFQGSAHLATDDAENTALLYLKLKEFIK